MLPLLRISQQRKVINMYAPTLSNLKDPTLTIKSSSALGSIALTGVFSFSQPCAAYKVSKAALNMLTSQWAASFRKDGIIVLSISPGVSNHHSSILASLSTNT
jgi:NAD(P)-dependent dehydrogenase (short-subunit alcohol dehydrogenase family)